MYKQDLKLSDEEIHDSTPDPKGYKILIALPEMVEKTEGGVFVPDELKLREQTASIIAFVVKLGDLCYQDKEKFPTGPWCEQGDWIMFRPYSGTRFIYKKQEFRLINDDSVEAIVPDPREVKRVGSY